MDGVAYSTGNFLDEENKEIHFSAGYISSQSQERVRDEIRGVLIHEMVHVWQYNGTTSVTGFG
jgi:Peptidase of plants and bacteria